MQHFDWTLAVGAVAVVGLMMAGWLKGATKREYDFPLQGLRKHLGGMERASEPAGHWRVIGQNGEVVAEGEKITRWAERWLGTEDGIERERRTR